MLSAQMSALAMPVLLVGDLLVLRIHASFSIAYFYLGTSHRGDGSFARCAALKIHVWSPVLLQKASGGKDS